VSAFKYEGDVVQEVMSKLGLARVDNNAKPRKNQSLNSAAVALLRTINRYDMKAKDKELIMPHLKEINGLVQRYANESLIDEESRKRVLKLSRTVSF
jgi:hypothetical protein